MTLPQKIGQMVIVDFSGTEITPSVQQHLQQLHIGGVILFAKNVSGRHQVRALCNRLQETAERPLFISIDQEGGIVNRLAFPETPTSPGNMALGATASDEYAYRTAAIYGQDLKSLGINLNFAPCVDVNNNPSNPIIGIRSFGESPDLVSRLGLAAARGYREAGVIPCAKHFPGHGDTHMDSHLALPVVRQPRARLDQVELRPFRALVEQGVEMIMTAHLCYPALEPRENLPATLSATILTGLLRQEMGFQGVVVTDSMSMHAISQNFGTGAAAVMAIEAGADIVLACGSAQAQSETVQALLHAVEEGRLSEDRIDQSLRRIFTLKQKFALGTAPPPTAEAVDYMLAVARDSVTLVRNDQGLIPLTAKNLLLLSPTRLPVSPNGEIGAAFPLAETLRALGKSVEEHAFSLAEAQPELAALSAMAHRCEAAVACLYARDRLSEAQLQMMEVLRQSGRPLVVVAINNPYILTEVPWVSTYLCTYGYTRPSMLALADVLSGRCPARGRLPVTIPV